MFTPKETSVLRNIHTYTYTHNTHTVFLTAAVWYSLCPTKERESILSVHLSLATVEKHEKYI